MTSELFARVGAALYGDAWMGCLADALLVAPRTVARWASGYSRIPPNVWDELRLLAEQRADLIAMVRADLDIAIARTRTAPAGSAHDRPPAT